MWIEFLGDFEGRQDRGHEDPQRRASDVTAGAHASTITEDNGPGVDWRSVVWFGADALVFREPSFWFEGERVGKATFVVEDTPVEQTCKAVSSGVLGSLPFLKSSARWPLTNSSQR